VISTVVMFQAQIPQNRETINST